ncbi:MAG: dTDP-4-dehydrorhamnose 3,5-epimerase family protein [Anaerolineales bacterium]
MVVREHPIADMHVFPLNREAGRLTLLRNTDHLLRRFGQLDLLDLAAGEQTEFSLRAEADRFLFAIRGRVSAVLLDLRQVSPTHKARAEVVLDGDHPQGLLLPFGVACSLSATSAARLVQLSTHSEAHPADRTLTSDEI